MLTRLALENSVAKFHSPLTPETKDLLFTEDLAVPRVNSKIHHLFI